MQQEWILNDFYSPAMFYQNRSSTRRLPKPVSLLPHWWSIWKHLHVYQILHNLFYLDHIQVLFQTRAKKNSLQWWEEMVYLLIVLLYIEFLWSQMTISDFHGLKYQWTAGRIWEVKPACVCPITKEFKTWFFLFDCRPDMCGGRKK